MNELIIILLTGMLSGAAGLFAVMSSRLTEKEDRTDFIQGMIQVTDYLSLPVWSNGSTLVWLRKSLKLRAEEERPALSDEEFVVWLFLEMGRSDEEGESRRVR